jgi:AcrR family transcriptional regulator
MNRSGAVGPLEIRTRRSQAERRNETRERLLQGAVRCLETLGHARTTTTEVCRLAGVSQGALFKHFASKAALMAAAAGYLFSSLALDYKRRFARLPDGAARLPAAIDLLWSLFETPRMHAAFELYVAARTEPDLARSLKPVADAHYRNLHQLARELFPPVGPVHSARFDALVDLIIGAFQGAALGNLAAPTEQRSALVTLACELADRVIQQEKSTQTS